jgi:DNA-binding beta-propeller fold protein YncE
MSGDFAAGSFPAAMAFDSTNIWVVNAGSGTVMKFRASDGSLLTTVSIGSNLAAITFDNANVWVTQLVDWF